MAFDKNEKIMLAVAAALVLLALYTANKKQVNDADGAKKAKAKKTAMLLGVIGLGLGGYTYYKNSKGAKEESSGLSELYQE